MNFTYAIDNVTKFSHLSQFRDVKDFNNNIEMFLAGHKEDFTKSELIAFKRLVRLACKVPGIATASISYVLDVISDKGNGYGISESTFHRMRRKAVKLGILTIETTERTDGSQSSNLWIFNRVDVVSNANDTPSELENGHEVPSDKESIVRRLKPHKTDKILKANIHTLQDTEPTGHKHSRALSQAIPKVIYESLAPYFDAQGLYRTYGILLRAKAKVDNRITVEEYGSMYVDVFLNAIRLFKQGKVRKPIARKLEQFDC